MKKKPVKKSLPLPGQDLSGKDERDALAAQEHMRKEINETRDREERFLIGAWRIFRYFMAGWGEAELIFRAGPPAKIQWRGEVAGNLVVFEAIIGWEKARDAFDSHQNAEEIGKLLSHRCNAESRVLNNHIRGVDKGIKTATRVLRECGCDENLNPAADFFRKVLDDDKKT